MCHFSFLEVIEIGGVWQAFCADIYSQIQGRRPILWGQKGFWTWCHPSLFSHQWYDFSPLPPALLIACFLHVSTAIYKAFVCLSLTSRELRQHRFSNHLCFPTSCGKHYGCEVIQPMGILLWMLVCVLVSSSKNRRNSHHCCRYFGLVNRRKLSSN